MKTSLTYCLVSVLLATAGCNTTRVDDQTATQTTKEATGSNCETAKAVPTITDAKGFVDYDQTTRQYRILSSVPGTIDEVNVGVVCGELSADVKTEGRKVVFSGTYKEYANAPAMPGGHTMYYLSVSKIAAE